MKIQYASDLHLEMALNSAFMEGYPLKPCADILILAGDVTYLNNHHLNSKIINGLSSDFKEVYIIPGNHEFYGKYLPISATLPSFRKEIRENVYYLNNETVIIDDVRILFTTLFSHIPSSSASLIGSRINDFYASKFHKESNKSLTIEEFNHCHKICLGYLLFELEKPFYGKTLVVSHFAPFHKGWIKDYPKFPVDLSDFFHASLEYLCKEHSIDHWISGHTHINFKSFQIGNTWMHSNMLGYVEAGEHKEFKKDKVIEI